MKNWTIGKRLTAGFLVLIAVVLCSGTITWLQMRGISRNLALITQEDMPELALAEGIRYQVATIRITNLKHAVYKEAAQKNDLNKQALDEEAQLADMVAQYEHHLDTPEQKAIFGKLPGLLAAYQVETKKLREASSQNNAEQTQAYLQSAGKIGNEFLQLVGNLAELSRKGTSADTKNIESATAFAKWLAVIVSAVTVVLSLLISVIITRSISHVLRGLANQLLIGAEHTTAAAGQVSASSQSLAEGSSEQAASLEETSASLEEVSSMTQRNAQNAQSSKEFTAKTRQTAEVGAQSTKEMGQAMQGIRAASAEMREAMNGIKAASNDVSKIIKTIDEIAFQTNILALNAAVEAARAGEAGMGFAVVADEVRNLAQRSAKAARETTDMIETSIQRGEAGVRVTEKVTNSVEEVSAKSHLLEEKLAEILMHAQQVDEQVGQIASASAEQTEGISQVSTAVSQMDKVTQSNAASAEESAAAAEELNAQAEMLKDAVQELQKLVGGSQTEISTPNAPAKVPKIARSPSVSPAKANGHSHVAPKPRSVTPAKSSQPAPIPMEHADFKDF